MSVNGKLIYWDYDAISARSTSERAVCLTEKERAILINTLEFVGWKTRWKSTIGTTIVQDTIDGWRDTLIYKLGSTDCSMDCGDVLACLIDALGDDDASLRIALEAWIRDHQGNILPYPAGDELSQAVTNNLNEYGCDADIIYGFALQLVQLFHALAQDLFEIIEVVTNAVELISAVVDSIPLLTEATDLISFFQEAIYENYLANYDSALETTIACELWCLMVGNDSCSLTWNDLLTYFSLKAAYELEDLTIWDWASFCTAGVWDGDDWVFITFMTVAAILGLGGDWAGITLAQVERLVLAFFNDPNSDWETQCEVCTWRVDYDFDQNSLRGWAGIVGQFQVDNEHNWETYNDPGVSCKAIIEYEFPVAIAELSIVRVTGCTITYSGNHDGAGVYLYVDHNGGQYTATWYGNPAGNIVQFDLVPTLTDVTKVKIIIREDNVGDGGYGHFNGVILNGRGLPKAPPPTEME